MHIDIAGSHIDQGCIGVFRTAASSGMQYALLRQCDMTMALYATAVILSVVKQVPVAASICRLQTLYVIH